MSFPAIPFLYWITFAGACCSYIVQKNKRRVPFSVFSAVNVDVGENAKPPVIFLDIVVTSVLGSFIVFFFSEPATKQQALVAGLGFTGIMAVIDRGDKR